MREIKFRAYSHRAKKMYQWEDLTNEEIGDMLRNPQEEIMQYTGLKDKKGKEIYEGDIILATIIENLLPSGENSEYVDKRVVEWNKEQGGFAFAEDEYEIIGNIYENKDLLTK